MKKINKLLITLCVAALSVMPINVHAANVKVPTTEKTYIRFVTGGEKFKFWGSKKYSFSSSKITVSHDKVKQVFMLDKKGKVKKELYTGYNAKNFPISYKYNTKGQLTQKKAASKAGSYVTATYSYNNKGQLKKIVEKAYIAEEKMKFSNITTYSKYDSKGNPTNFTHKTDYFSGSGTYKVSVKYKYSNSKMTEALYTTKWSRNYAPDRVDQTKRVFSNHKNLKNNRAIKEALCLTNSNFFYQFISYLSSSK